MYSLLFILFTIVFSLALGCPQSCCEERRQIILDISQFEHCEGEDASNFTLIREWTQDSYCSIESSKYDHRDDILISCQHNSQKAAYQLRNLARSTFLAGGYFQDETLYLVISSKDSGKGSLEGKYVYLKEYNMKTQYLKKCASILGYPYISSKQSILLISKKLDLNVFIDPIGAFETFKKGCTTICKGMTYLV